MIDLDFKVLKLIYRSEKPLKIGKISKLLDIPHQTLNSCIGRLKEQGLVNWKAYYDVLLTEKGYTLANEIIRHAQLMEILLYEELGLTVEEAHTESEKFNLLFDCNTINKICEKYGHPKKSPCGEIILNSCGCFCRENFN